MLRIPEPIQELRSPWMHGLRSLQDACRSAGSPRQEGVLPSCKPPALLGHGARPFPLPTTEWLIPPLSGGLIMAK